MTGMRRLDELLTAELEQLKNTKTFKYETELEGPQDGIVRVKRRSVIMLAANNYIGMANHPAIKKAAIEGIKKYGYGMASVRFICGTQTIHRVLEKKIAKFVGTEDAILFSSCWAANEAFFASLCNEKLGTETHTDVIYSDRLNHASIIDGQRLTRSETCERKVYQHADLNDLERQLEDDRGKNYRFRIIATDGVFSMEGDLAPLDRLVEIARRHEAILFVDDSHAIGVVGKTGRGTPEHFNVLGKVDVITGTLGKAIGGAAGGYIAGKRELVEFMRQKARTYIFSNSLPPPIVTACLASLDVLSKDRSIVRRLHENTAYFRREIVKLGFTILEGTHPIVPIMLGEAALAQDMATSLLKEGVFIKGLWFPVVPQGQARLRAQISAALKKSDIDRALAAFKKVGGKFGVI